ncbi:MAG: HD domain-containing protein [Ferruginibacter sp.]
MTNKEFEVYIEKVEKYVRHLFYNHCDRKLVYHNLVHTEHVIKRIKEIAAHYSLSLQDEFILYCAGWFHDTGHLFVPAGQHERKGIELMEEFLSPYNIDEVTITLVARCIFVTKFPGQPLSLPEKIICDADLYHLGTPAFITIDKLVKKEFELRNNFVPANWNELTLSFLQAHHYYTGYCQNLLNDGKKKNIALVSAMVMKDKSES